MGLGFGGSLLVINLSRTTENEVEQPILEELHQHLWLAQGLGFEFGVLGFILSLLLFITLTPRVQ